MVDKKLIVVYASNSIFCSDRFDDYILMEWIEEEDGDAPTLLTTVDNLASLILMDYIVLEEWCGRQVFDINRVPESDLPTITDYFIKNR